jgi:hypothetical protein
MRALSAGGEICDGGWLGWADYVGDQIDELYRCCSAFYERQGPDGSTPSCPKLSILR